MKNICFFIFLLLLSFNLYASNEVLIQTDADYAAVFCARAKNADVKLRFMRMGDNPTQPYDGVLEDWFRQTPDAEKAENEFDRQRKKLAFIERVKSTRSQINDDSTVVFYINVRLDEYDFKRKRFAIINYQTARVNGTKLTFNTGEDKNAWLTFIMDPSLREYIEIDEIEAEKIAKVENFRGYVRFKMYGKLTKFTREAPPSFNVEKWEVLNDEGDVISSKQVISSKMNRDNAYMIIKVRDTDVFFHDRREIFRVSDANKVISVNSSMLVNNIQMGGRGSHRNIGITSFPDGPCVIKYKHAIFGKPQLLIAKLPDEPASYQLLKSGDEKAIEAAFHRYYKK